MAPWRQQEDKAQMRVKGNVWHLGTGDEGRQPVLRGAKDRRPPVTRGAAGAQGGDVAKMTRHYDEKLKESERTGHSPVNRGGVLAPGRLRHRRRTGGREDKTHVWRQKSRLVLAAAMWTKPHGHSVDEPTNYLDNETSRRSQRRFESSRAEC